MGSVRVGEQNRVNCDLSHTPFAAQLLPLMDEMSKGTAMLRHTLFNATVVLFTGAVTPSIPAGAGMDPAAFINNPGDQLQAVTSSASRE
jgi:hypothetical protein